MFIITFQLFDLPAFQTSKRISVYCSTKHEISTEPIIRHIFEDGKSVFVPRFVKLLCLLLLASFIVIV